MKYKDKKIQYTAVYEEALEGGYNVFFPAFPGCVTFGRTYEEAEKNAAEVLELWLEELSLNKQKIPVSKNRPLIGEVQVNLPDNAKLIYAPTAC